jgi:hypothetical protein
VYSSTVEEMHTIISHANRFTCGQLVADAVEATTGSKDKDGANEGAHE